MSVEKSFMIYRQERAKNSVSLDWENACGAENSFSGNTAASSERQMRHGETCLWD